MRTLVQKFCFFTIGLMALLPLNGFSQNLTGIWRGWFVTEGQEQYRYELQIEQSKTNRISGVSYAYLDTRFYGKATLTGSYVKKNLSALIQEIKTVEVKMSSGSVACIMKCLFTYSKSGKEEFLEGEFTSGYEKSDPLMGIKRGGNCGGGRIFLRKVATSDFYVEPFLRNKPQFKERESPNTSIAKAKPQAKPSATNKTLVKRPPVARDQNITKTEVITRPDHDTINRNSAPIVIDKAKEIPAITIPPTTRSRENLLVKTLTVNSEDISVRLYDNGEIDGDSISVYLDGKAIVSNKGLSTVPITVHLKMNRDNSDHVLVMYAENMGRIPPNTALMIVQDGDKRYQVNITSTEQTNAMIRFHFQNK